MKIYDHPLNSDVTVIEIEKHDEREEFLSNIIDGFEQFGEIYPSSSFEEDGDKKVIYLDSRDKVIFDSDEVDTLCKLTVGLASINQEEDLSIEDQCINLAEAAGNQELVERLMSRTPEYFNSFRFFAA